MKNRNIVKLILDVCMFVILMLLYSKQTVSLTFHEVAGLLMLGIALIHVIINRKWLAGVTKQLFSKSLPVKTRIGYTVDVLLCICLAVMIVSSVLISKKIFGFNNHTLIPVHFFTAALMLALAGIHVGLHLDFIRNTVFGVNKRFAKPVTVITLAAALGICGFGIYSLCTSSFIRWITVPVTGPQIPGGEHGGSQMGPGGPGTPAGSMQKPEQGSIPLAGPQNGAQMQGSQFQGGQPPVQQMPPSSGEMSGEQGMHQDLPFSWARIMQVFCTFFSIAFLFAVITFVIEQAAKRARKNT